MGGDIKKPAVICTLNDLEAQAIVTMVRDHACSDYDPDSKEIRPSFCQKRSDIFNGFLVIAKEGVRWGEAFSLQDKELEELQGRVVYLVEINNHELEKSIQGMNCEIFHIDHHVYTDEYGNLVDRRSSLSALEQIASRFAVDLTQGERWIGANDRGYIPLLAREMKEGKQERNDPGISENEFCPESTSARQSVSITSPQADCHNEQVNSVLWNIRCADLSSHIRNGQERKRITRDDIVATAQKINAAYCDGYGRRFDTGRRNINGDMRELYFFMMDEDSRFEFMDGLYYWRKHCVRPSTPLQFPLEVLVLFYKNGDEQAGKIRPQYTSLEYHGPANRMETVAEWMGRDIQTAWGLQRLTCYGGGTEGVFFGAVDGFPGTESVTLSQLADHLLDELLIGNRPVRGWHVHYSQPFRFEWDEDWLGLLRSCANNSNPDVAKKPEQIYFMEHLRSHLTPNEKAYDDLKAGKYSDQEEQHMWSFDLSANVADLSLKLASKDYPAPIYEPVRSARIHFFYNNTIIIEWSFERNQKVDLCDEVEVFNRESESNIWLEPKSIWAQYLMIPDLYRKYGTGPDILAQVQDKIARYCFCYSAYIGEAGYLLRLYDGERPLGRGFRMGEDVASVADNGWFIALMNKILGSNFECLSDKPSFVSLFDKDKGGKARLVHLADERARTQNSVIVYGREPMTADPKREMSVVHHHLNTVDEYGQDFFYDPDFSKREYESGLYDRFLKQGQIFNVTDHSFMFFAYNDGFTHGLVHNLHMRTIYRKMWLMTLMYRAVLDEFQIALQYDEDNPQIIRKERSRLNKFTTNLWYSRFTSQIQGVELQEKMNLSHRLKDEYDVIVAEVERSEGFLNEKHQQKTAHLQNILSYVAVPLAIFFGFLGLKEYVDVFPLWPMVERLGVEPYLVALAVVLATVLLVPAVSKVFGKVLRLITWSRFSSKSLLTHHIVVTVVLVGFISWLLFHGLGVQRDELCKDYKKIINNLGARPISELSPIDAHMLGSALSDGADKCADLKDKFSP